MAKINKCDIYGCFNVKMDPRIEVVVNLVPSPKIVEVCQEHKTFFETFSTDMFDVFLNHQGEVQFRPIPAFPIVP